MKSQFKRISNMFERAQESYREQLYPDTIESIDLMLKAVDDHLDIISMILPENLRNRREMFFSFLDTVSLYGGCWSETICENKEDVDFSMDSIKEIMAYVSKSSPRRYGTVNVLESTGAFKVKDIIPIIGTIVEIDGTPIDLTKDRFICFRESGITCKKCGTAGSYFRFEKVMSKNFSGWTLNLYDKNLMYFTKDHVIPKSLGGPDLLSNYQTYCWKCNLEKGSTSI